MRILQTTLSSNIDDPGRRINASTLCHTYVADCGIQDLRSASRTHCTSLCSCSRVLQRPPRCTPRLNPWRLNAMYWSACSHRTSHSIAVCLIILFDAGLSRNRFSRSQVVVVTILRATRPCVSPLQKLALTFNGDYRLHGFYVIFHTIAGVAWLVVDVAGASLQPKKFAALLFIALLHIVSVLCSHSLPINGAASPTPSR